MSKEQSANSSIVKIDNEKRQVFGWASIIKDESGKILLDRQDDFIDSEDELEKAAYDYVLHSRDGGEMHVRRGVSKMIESIVFTEEKQRAMGIPTGSMPTGWWIGFQVTDDRVWEQVKKGDYAGFSVHGTGKRESTELPIEKVTEIGKADMKKKKNKIATVMGEFKAGKLKSSSGEKVTDPKQAMAIAISEQKRSKMKKVAIAEIVAKTEELKKVGDRPGHPFRGNQYTSGKGRGTGAMGGGRLPHGGSKQSLERAKAKQLARAQKFREKTSAKLAETNSDGTPKYASRGTVSTVTALSAPNAPKATKQRLERAKPIDGEGKRVYSNTIFANNRKGDRMKNDESTDVHVFADTSSGTAKFRVEIHEGSTPKGKTYNQKPIFEGAEQNFTVSRSGKSPVFDTQQDAQKYIEGLGSGGAGRGSNFGSGKSRSNEPVDWYGIQ